MRRLGRCDAEGTKLRFVASHPSIRERLMDGAPRFVAIEWVGHPPNIVGFFQCGTLIPATDGQLTVIAMLRSRERVVTIRVVGRAGRTKARTETG